MNPKDPKSVRMRVELKEAGWKRKDLGSTEYWTHEKFPHPFSPLGWTLRGAYSRQIRSLKNVGPKD